MRSSPPRGAASAPRAQVELAGLLREAVSERAHGFSTLDSAKCATAWSARPLLGMEAGMKLAQAIAHGPAPFPDEPMNGSTSPARLRMIQLIQEIRDRGDLHLVLSSHLLRDVEDVLRPGAGSSVIGNIGRRNSKSGARTFGSSNCSGRRSRTATSGGQNDMGCRPRRRQGIPNRPPRRLRREAASPIAASQNVQIAASVISAIRSKISCHGGPCGRLYEDLHAVLGSAHCTRDAFHRPSALRP